VFESKPEIRLNNPTSGNYTIEVAYQNEDGVWIRPVKLATFVVAGPFWTKWYFVLTTIVAFAGGVYVLFRIRIRQISQRHYLRGMVNKLEQKALSAQMNPHFIFNSLNSIQSFLIYEENAKAEKYLLKFSSLIRQTLANSREHYIRLEEELTILRNYLELEQMRFRDKFSFVIKCELSQAELEYFLPPMLIQPYIENAVVHGVAAMEKHGEITVTFSLLAGNQLRVEIDDNGVGRKASGHQRKHNHRSFGTTITQERLSIFQEQLGGEFNVSITDKVVDEEAAGTRVELMIPLLEDYAPENTMEAAQKPGRIKL
jgi:LytS/YehU family sensor histidine kinase